MTVWLVVDSCWQMVALLAEWVAIPSFTLGLELLEIFYLDNVLFSHWPGDKNKNNSFHIFKNIQWTIRWSKFDGDLVITHHYINITGQNLTTEYRTDRSGWPLATYVGSRLVSYIYHLRFEGYLSAFSVNFLRSHRIFLNSLLCKL